MPTQLRSCWMFSLLTAACTENHYLMNTLLSKTVDIVYCVTALCSFHVIDEDSIKHREVHLLFCGTNEVYRFSPRHFSEFDRLVSDVHHSFLSHKINPYSYNLVLPGFPSLDYPLGCQAVLKC